MVVASPGTVSCGVLILVLILVWKKESTAAVGVRKFLLVGVTTYSHARSHRSDIKRYDGLGT